MLAALIDPGAGLTMVDVNKTYEASSGRTREQIVGQSLFELFPDNPNHPDADGTAKLFASLQAVAESGQAHEMGLQRYDTQDAEGVWTARYWRPVNTPLHDDKRAIDPLAARCEGGDRASVQTAAAKRQQVARGTSMNDIIRAGSLWGYVQLTRFLAHDPAPLLAEAGLSEADLDNPDRYISRPAVVALLELSAERFKCSDFGLRLGSMQDIYILGALAFAMRNAPDLRGALETMIRHVNFHAPLVSIRTEPGDNADEERIVFYHEGDEPHSTAQMTERAMSLFCRVDDHLTGKRVGAKRIMFAHAAVSSSDVYAQYFSVMPEFNAPVTGICMSRRDLALPVTTANPQLHAIVERYLEINAPTPETDVRRRVREAIVQIMRHDNATIEDVAAMLNTHPRTLQRRLTAAGTTFERARDEVRKYMAEIYLANDVVPLAYVAQLLGYANQSVLTRSCVRWFGKTPLAMRQEVTRGR